MLLIAFAEEADDRQTLDSSDIMEKIKQIFGIHILTSQQF